MLHVVQEISALATLFPTSISRAYCICSLLTLWKSPSMNAFPPKSPQKFRQHPNTFGKGSMRIVGEEKEFPRKTRKVDDHVEALRRSHQQFRELHRSGQEPPVRPNLIEGWPGPLQAHASFRAFPEQQIVKSSVRSV